MQRDRFYKTMKAVGFWGETYLAMPASNSLLRAGDLGHVEPVSAATGYWNKPDPFGIPAGPLTYSTINDKNAIKCDFYPRMYTQNNAIEKKEVIKQEFLLITKYKTTKEIPKTESLFRQGNATPGFKKGVGDELPDDEFFPKIEIDKCACLVHGIPVGHLQLTLARGFLVSAYALNGPCGKYSRTADEMGGGSTAIYTRAVGKKYEEWKAKGYGVGSNRPQLIIDPKVLLDPRHVWRCTGADIMGRLPGVVAGPFRKAVRLGTADLYDAWSLQSRKGRNESFNLIFDGDTMKVLNEQTHWERLSLIDWLIAIVITEADLQQVEGICEYTTSHRFTMCHDKKIPIIVVDNNDMLLTKLRDVLSI